MKRRQFITQTGIGSLLMMTPGVEAIVNSFLAAGYEMRMLRNNVGIFTERGGTIAWMITPESAVVVDSQFPEQAKHLIDEIRKQTSAPIDYLINTHHHGDHSGGNIAFKGLAKKVVAHENSKINQQRSAEARGNQDTQLYPDVTFDKHWKAKAGDEHIEIHYHGAGHTNGDGIIHFKDANVAHVGDLVFNRRFPYIDKGAGASIQNWIVVLEKIHKHFDNDTIIVCGHADNGHDIVITRDDVMAFRNYLENVLSTVGKAIRDGMSREEVMAIQAINNSPEWKGKGIQRSLSAAYQELAEE